MSRALPACPCVLTPLVIAAQVQDKQQRLDSLAASLKQIEKYNEQMNSEIAVKRREAYATEEAVQKLEKDKMDQDFLIDGLQVSTPKPSAGGLGCCSSCLAKSKPHLYLDFPKRYGSYRGFWPLNVLMRGMPGIVKVQYRPFLFHRAVQDTMKSLHQQLELYDDQLTNQKRETRAAQETLAEAESEMQAVHFEKKQLLAQWQSSITAVKR